MRATKVGRTDMSKWQLQQILPNRTLVESSKIQINSASSILHEVRRMGNNIFMVRPSSKVGISDAGSITESGPVFPICLRRSDLL
jgi:hypothetical protein